MPAARGGDVEFLFSDHRLDTDRREARCPACRTTGDVDLRTLDWHRERAP